MASIAWLGFSGFDESLAYYKTVDELKLMKDDAYDKRLRVAGNVVAGSIERLPGAVKFKLEQKGDIVPVNYVGRICCLTPLRMAPKLWRRVICPAQASSRLRRFKPSVLRSMKPPTT